MRMAVPLPSTARRRTSGRTNRGAYVTCVAHTADEFAGNVLITGTHKVDYVGAASNSDVGNH